jgi:hypothetical protein
MVPASPLLPAPPLVPALPSTPAVPLALVPAAPFVPAAALVPAAPFVPAAALVPALPVALVPPAPVAFPGSDRHPISGARDKHVRRRKIDDDNEVTILRQIGAGVSRLSSNYARVGASPPLLRTWP